MRPLSAYLEPVQVALNKCSSNLPVATPRPMQLTYSYFRAPTLTELYRQFSVGAVTTRPNDQLNPERLTGGEAGVNVAPAKNLTARFTWFDNRVENPISNVTLTQSIRFATARCATLMPLGLPVEPEVKMM